MKTKIVNEIDALNLVRDEFNRLLDERIEKNEYNKLLENIPNLKLGQIKKIYEHISESLLNSDEGVNVMRKYIKTIKENKSLKNVYSFYNFIDCVAFPENINTQLNEALACFLLKVNKNEFNEKLNELGNIVSEGVKISNISKFDIEKIIENTNKVYEDVDYLLMNKKTLKNLNEHIQRKTNIINYITEKGNVSVEKNDINENFSNNELVKTINEDLNNINEPWLKELVENITLYNLSNRDYKTLFENYKNECLSIIENVESDKNEFLNKTKLSLIKENLNKKTYNKETFNTDIINLAELKSTLKESNEYEN